MPKVKDSEQELKKELADVLESIDAPPTADSSLFQRILWVRDRVTRLGKDSTVSTGSGSYKAITHDKVTAFIRPKLVQAGIFHYMSCISSEDFETGALTQRNRKIIQHRARFEITFANANDKGDSITVQQMAYADDYGDKAPGKAASYAMKYALLKMFMIETGEEDEARVEDDGGRGAVIADDENKLADIWAVAEECFADDAKQMLKDMAERRFFVQNYGEIPMDRYDDAVRSLRRKADSLGRTDRETSPQHDA